MTATINYRYMDGCSERYGTWTGSVKDAVDIAVLVLDAHQTDTGWCYYAEEIGEDVSVTEEELVQLGAGLLSGRSITALYSLWCA